MPTVTAAQLDHGTPQWRPALHYTPQKNWMNDPNGLVYDRGLYHLFYQYNPHGNQWGNMSWGHATSKDLIHWSERPVAMANNAVEEIFSGSIVVDGHNTSGLGSSSSPPLVALYTSVYKKGSGHAPGVQAQSLAYSTDAGKSWHKYAKNPVLTLHPESLNFRDPKVSWYAKGGYWLMTTVVANANVVKIYKSKNLIDWDFLSDFGPAGVTGKGMLWEMPDLFPLPLDGNEGDPRWVMIVNINPWSIAGGSGAEYFVGRFDGRSFHADNLPPPGSDPSAYLWLDHGADYYAAGTFANAPSAQPIAISWMSNWDYADRVPTSPWRGANSLPRQLALRTIDGRPQLTFKPVEQYAAFVRRHRTVRPADIRIDSTRKPLAADTRGTVQDIELTLAPRSAHRAGIVVRGSADGKRGTRIFYDAIHRTLTLDRSTAVTPGLTNKFSTQHIVNLPLDNGKLKLHVVVDRGSVEVFAGDGHVVITDLIFPGLGDDRVALYAEGGEAEFSDLAVTNLGKG
jgi:levanbiose-producing levanase